MAKSATIKRFMLKALKIIGALWLLQLLFVLLLRWIPVPITPLIIIRGIEKVGTEKPLGYHKKWKSWNNISDHVKVAVMCAEDQNFLKHRGFDMGAIEKAVDYNKKMEKRGSVKRRGASTISQQTAKNVFLWPQRSWLRKGLELYFTFLIETFWGKKRILEVYLNIIELGDGVYGVEAAAQQYWKTNALKLTREQSALIAGVLPSPRKYSATRPGNYMQNRKAWILQQMRFNTTMYAWVKES